MVFGFSSNSGVLLTAAQQRAVRDGLAPVAFDRLDQWTSTRAVRGATRDPATGLVRFHNRNVPRLEPVTAAGILTVTTMNTHQTIGTLPSEGMLVQTNGAGQVYKTDPVTGVATEWFDAFALTDVDDDTITDFLEFTYDGDVIRLIWIGNFLTEETRNCQIYRSINGGEWTQVFDGDGTHYPSATPRSAGVFGPLVVWGEYLALYGSPRVYASIDAGATWGLIYTEETQTTSHVHVCRCLDRRTIWVQLGESGGVVELTLGDDDATWTAARRFERSQFIDDLVPLPDGRVLNSGFYGLGEIRRDTFHERPLIHMPYRETTGTYLYYKYVLPANLSIRRITLAPDNTLIGSVNNYHFGEAGVVSNQQGILVSADFGRSIAAVYTTLATAGFRNTWSVGGKLVANAIAKSVDLGTVKTRATTGIRLDAGVPNVLEGVNSTFCDAAGSPSVGNWVGHGTYPPATLEAVSGGESPDGCCLHIVTNDDQVDADAGRNYIRLRVDSVAPGSWTLGESPFVMAKMRIRSPNWSPLVYRLRMAMEGFAVNQQTTDYISDIGPEWRDIWVAGRVVATENPTTESYLSLFIIKQTIAASPANAVMDIYVDDVQLLFADDRVPDHRSLALVDGLSQTDESVYTDVNLDPAISNRWTLTLDHQGPGIYEAATGTIATVYSFDGTKALTITWNATTQKYELSDGTTTAAAATAHLRNPNDLVRFWLVHNGSEVLLYVADPQNGTQVVGTGSGLTLAGIGRLYLGYDAEDDDQYEPGRFWNVTALARDLSATEVAEAVLLPGVGIVDERPVEEIGTRTIYGTAGTLTYAMPESGPLKKTFVCYLAGYTGDGVTIDFPVPFQFAPSIRSGTAADDTVMTVTATATTTTLTVTATTQTGWLIVEGF